MSGARSGSGPGRSREADLGLVEVADDGRKVVERPVKPAYVVMEKRGPQGHAVNLAMVATADWDLAAVGRDGQEEGGGATATVSFAVPGLEGPMDTRRYVGDDAVRIVQAIELLALGEELDDAQRIAAELSAMRRGGGVVEEFVSRAA